MTGVLLLMTVPVLVARVAIVAPATSTCRFERVGDPAGEQQAVSAFVGSVEAYAELHRRLARPLLLATGGADREQAAIAAATLRDALRAAHPQARGGQIFTPAVADVFRLRIRRAIVDHDYDARAMAASADEGAAAYPARLAVNAAVPWDAPLARWPVLEAVLPPLPAELEYRFAGRDLVLLDIDADLVVDVLDLALPAD